MKKLLTGMLWTSLLAACGAPGAKQFLRATHSGSTAQEPLPGAAPPAVSIDVATAGAASAPSSASPSAGSSDMTPMPADKMMAAEKITPPVRITGVFLAAYTMQETQNGFAASTIGLIAYSTGVRTSTQPQEYSATYSLSPANNPNITVKLVPSTDPRFDRMLQFQGGSISEIQSLYSALDMTVAVTSPMGSSGASGSIQSFLDKTAAHEASQPAP